MKCSVVATPVYGHELAAPARVPTGQRFPALNAVQARDGRLVLVEGHTRATAYALARTDQPVEVLVALSPEMSGWVFL